MWWLGGMERFITAVDPASGGLQLLLALFAKTKVPGIERMSDRIDHRLALAQVERFDGIDAAGSVFPVNEAVIPMVSRVPDLVLEVALPLRHALGVDIEPAEPPGKHLRCTVRIDRVDSEVAGPVVHHAVTIFRLG